MAHTSFRLTVVNNLRAVYVLFFGFATLCQIGQAFAPGKGGIGLSVFAVGFAGVCLVLTIRGARAATIVVDGNQLEYRALHRTRRWSRSDLDEFEVRESREGWAGYRRRVLYVRQTDGRVRKLQEINAGVRRTPNPVDEIAARLNAWIAAARQPQSPS